MERRKGKPIPSWLKSKRCAKVLGATRTLPPTFFARRFAPVLGLHRVFACLWWCWKYCRLYPLLSTVIEVSFKSERNTGMDHAPGTAWQTRPVLSFSCCTSLERPSCLHACSLPYSVYSYKCSLASFSSASQGSLSPWGTPAFCPADPAQ